MQPLRQQYTYLDAKVLYESNHYAEIFTKCIDDIILNKHKFINKPIFFGWYYNHYNVNTNAGIKIYICIKDIEHNDGYIIRERNDKYITIYVNKLFINDDIKLKTIIQHELIHIVKMYATNYNGLDLTKETVRDEIDNILVNINWSFINSRLKVTYINKLDTILYMLTPNEQLATINATCKYISELNAGNIYDINVEMFNYCTNDFYINFRIGPDNFTTKESQIFNLLIYIANNTSTHFLLLFEDFLDIWEKLPIQFKLILCYCLDKHTHIKTPYIKKNINVILSNDIENAEILQEVNICHEYIENIYEQYKKNLIDAVYSIMYKKNLFLSDDKIKTFKYNNILQQANRIVK